MAIVECHRAETNSWDLRLNEAYKALKQRIDPSQQTPLMDAQRLWIRYRNSNCGFYAAAEGTIGRVQAAECVRTMTRQRACELEAAGNMESGADAGCP